MLEVLTKLFEIASLARDHGLKSIHLVLSSLVRDGGFVKVDVQGSLLTANCL